MTLDEFIDALSKTPRRWGTNSDGCIRIFTESGDITHVCPDLAVDAAVTPPHDTRAIWSAADNEPGHDPALRARLLKACGLKEAAP